VIMQSEHDVQGHPCSRYTNTIS